MFGSTNSNPFQNAVGLSQMSNQELSDYLRRYQEEVEQYKQYAAQLQSQLHYAQTAKRPTSTLSPKDAQDLLLQLEHDGVCIKDRKLLFGQHMTKDLRQVPLEYLVTVGAGVKQVRREILREIKRRRIAEKLEKS